MTTLWDGAGNVVRTDGTYSGTQVWQNVRDGADATISAQGHDTHDEGLADSIEDCLNRNGENAMAANIAAGSFKFTGVGNAAARDQFAAAGQVQDSGFIWCGTATGSKNALALTPSPAITAYAAGQRFRFIAGGTASDDAVTIAVSGLTTKAGEIDGAACSATVFIEAGKLYEADYDGTAFQLTRLSPTFQSFPTLTGTETLTGKTIGDELTLTKGGDIASASPLVIGSDGAYFDVTGTTGFSAMTVAAGETFILQFDGALTMTDGASLDLGGSDITTAAGDRGLFFATAANTVQLVAYYREGTSPIPMTQAQAEAGTDTVPRMVAAEQISQAIAALESPSLVPDTALATTSGTTKDFTIPAGTNRVTVLFNGVTGSGTDNQLVQLGDSGGIETTGYTSASSAGTSDATSTAGFIIRTPSAAAVSGIMTLCKVSDDVWVAEHSVVFSGAGVSGGGSRTTLDSALTTVRITWTGTDTFASGSVNVFTE